MQRLDVDAGERADSGIRLSSGGSLDVNVGDVTDVGVTGEQAEARDIEVLEYELDLVVLVFGPKMMVSAISTAGVKEPRTLGWGCP